MNRPYGDRVVVDDDDAVKMIGHDYGRIDGDTRESGREMFPGAPNYVSKRITLHFTVIDRAKEGFAVLGAQGDEIRTRVGIIGIRVAQ